MPKHPDKGQSVQRFHLPHSRPALKTLNPYRMRHGTVVRARRILHVVHVIDTNTDTKNDEELLEGTAISRLRDHHPEPLGYLSLDVIYHCIELESVNSASTSSDLVENSPRHL